MSDPKAYRLYLHAITPLHSGVGQVASVVDLPVAREKATGWPVVPGSSLKGVLRADYEARGLEDAGAVFGSQDAAGSVALSDLRILCLPVRSFYGTFAWVTSPLALRRYVRDARALGVAPGFEAPQATSHTLLAGNALTASGSSTVYLEDLDLEARKDDGAARIATAIGQEALDGDMAATFADRFAIVPDNVFDFLCATGTEVAARIAIGKDGTTRGDGNGGNLWYEESVPAEAIFCGFLADTGRGAGAEPLLNALGGERMVQIGGDSGIGRGLCRLVVKR